MRLLFNGSYLQLPQTGIATYCRNLLHHWQYLAPDMVAYLPQGWQGCEPYQPIPPTNHLTRLLWNQSHWLRHAQVGDVIFHPVPESGWSYLPQVTMAHDVIPLVYPQWYPKKKAYFQYWVPLSLRSSQHIICNSQQTKRDLIKYYQLDPEKITVIPLAYDHSHFSPGVIDSLPRPYLLYVGAHEPHKNLKTLITAFGQLSREWEGELWLGGRFDPRYTPELQALAAPLGTRVRWLDYVSYEQLPSLYQRAKAFIYPSLYEGFGLPLLEAMACGTAVISANSTSLPEVGGKAVAYFEPLSVADLVSVIQKVLGDSSYCHHLEQQGLVQAQTFDWAVTAAKTLVICQQIG